jgi:hypothetical protein
MRNVKVLVLSYFLISYSLFLILTFRNFSLWKAGYFIAAFNPSVVV